MKPARECRQLAILGVGLMGASIAAAHKKAFPETVIIGASPSHSDGEMSLEKGYIDRFTPHNAEAVRGADRVIIAAPPGTIVSIWKEIAPHLQGVPVTDIASVKGPLLALFDKQIERSFPGYISSHPMAGREESGAQAARANLFEGKLTFLVPFAQDHPEASPHTADWETFWTALGSRGTLTLAAGEHDRILSLISHLPHLLSYAILELLNRSGSRSDLPHWNWEEQKGGALADMTRISRSHPDLWGEILQANRIPLKEDLETLIDILSDWKETLDAPTPLEIARKIAAIQNDQMTLRKTLKKEKKENDAH